ncbi:hypothetical protein JVT61DRAFT_11593 [Boletus reticuloceps]|uniref:Uncharacterized protein n=1 Tax=Boletus reticuloceps TaxID=495285 RepID=A0A8I2YY64_9AGAM|nr:hypothetical protein JVT61DRAFT_11593 [Boletus reticuloceps]
MSVDNDSPASDSVFSRSPTAKPEIDELEGNNDSFSYLASRNSRHSSRSSSFNDSAAEIILGLFQREDRMASGLGTEYTDEEDPAVRDMLIRAELQKPDSWVRKQLAMVELWNDSEGSEEYLEAHEVLANGRIGYQQNCDSQQASENWGDWDGVGDMINVPGGSESCLITNDTL